MRINHNITALNTHRNMTLNNTAAGKSMEKLSSVLESTVQLTMLLVLLYPKKCAVKSVVLSKLNVTFKMVSLTYKLLRAQ